MNDSDRVELGYSLDELCGEPLDIQLPAAAKVGDRMALRLLDRPRNRPSRVVQPDGWTLCTLAPGEEVEVRAVRKFVWWKLRREVRWEVICPWRRRDR